MPTIRKRYTQSGSTTASPARTVYPMSGSQYEYLPFRARVRFGITTHETAATSPADINREVTASIFSGSDVLQQADVVQIGSSLGVVRDDEDFLVEDVAAAGERITVELNLPATDTTAAGDLVTDVVVQIIPA